MHCHTPSHSCHSSRALRLECQTDHLQSLMVPMGADRFRDIGRPRGGAAGASPAATLAEWQGLCEQVFPPKAPEARRPFDAAKQQYAEKGVPRPHRGKDCTSRRLKLAAGGCLL